VFLSEVASEFESQLTCALLSSLPPDLQVRTISACVGYNFFIFAGKKVEALTNGSNPSNVTNSQDAREPRVSCAFFMHGAQSL
jgi:hypothetical protein